MSAMVYLISPQGGIVVYDLGANGCISLVGLQVDDVQSAVPRSIGYQRGTSGLRQDGEWHRRMRPSDVPEIENKYDVRFVVATSRLEDLPSAVPEYGLE